MANPQIEHGHTRIANEILEQIAKTNLNGTQFRIVMVIWRFTYGFQRKQHELSNAFITKAIENNNRRLVIKELSTLVERKIISVVGNGSRGTKILSFNKNYDEWVEGCLNEHQSQLVSNQAPELVSNQAPELVSNQAPKKERTKESNKENIYVEIINHLNQKAGKRFSPKSQANRKLINGRLGEDRTLEDFFHVIDVKCEQWLDDPKMNEYLRPSTLFAQKNFENYVNEKQKVNHQQQPKKDIRDKEIEFQQWIAEGKDEDDFDWRL